MDEIRKASDEKFCFECGSVIRARAEICPNCGVRQPGFEIQQRRREPEKSRLVAGILALALGGVGAHKFYLGRYGQAVIYLLFFWAVIPSIISVVEGVRYLTMSDDVFEDRYLDY